MWPRWETVSCGGDLLLSLLSARLQTPTDRAKCHKLEGTSREGNPKKEKINKNEGKKDKNTIQYKIYLNNNKNKLQLSTQ